MKKVLCIVLALVCVFSLASCNKEDTIVDNDGGNSGTVTEEPKVEIADQEITVSNLNCRFTISNGGENGMVKGANAAKIYTFISENAKKPEKKKLDTSGQKNIYLSFQTDDTENVGNIDFLGSYIICENGAVIFTAMNNPSEKVYYKFPKNTYEEIVKIVTEK